ncbi:MAG: Gfo/Idh/MocA family oxidoreductase [candidate division NC10 bacterium]|nr:Gfo/Idh/MocA family oxidoreductase [candidate division NC10 bacterium]
MVPLRIVAWGAGFFGRKWLEAVKARNDCELAGVVSRTPARLEELRRDLGLAGVPGYGSFEEALAGGKPGAVIITLPQTFHCEATLKAIQAGLHVIVEKPMAMTMDEGRAIFQAARDHPDRVVMVSQNFRWRPHTLTLRKAIGNGRIGRPGHIMFECRQQIRRKTVDAWREQMPDPFLLDYAIHHFDLMRYLTGEEPREAVGVSFQPTWSWFEGNAAAAIVTMESGLVVNYGGTMVSHGLETPQEGLITVIGERGTLHLDGGLQVRVLGQGEPEVIPQEPVPEGELGHGLAKFVDAIRTGRLPETHVGDNIRSLALLLAVVESARRGQAVTLADMLTFL